MTEASRTKTVVIVGNGMVSWKLCCRLRERDPGRTLRIVVLGEEPRPAYDRVQLTKYFETQSAESLAPASASWHAQQGIELWKSVRATGIDRAARRVRTDGGRCLEYDVLVLATGSTPFVPPVPGIDREGVFVYRTIEDLRAIITYGERDDVERAAVLGGGLLGLEAARAVQLRGLETHVVEVAPRLMPRQLDETGGAILAATVRDLGVRLHLGMSTAEVLALPDGRVGGLAFRDGSILDVDMLVVSAGIRPRDELARDAGLIVGERGGIAVDDTLCTSDRHIFAIGECALHRSIIYGLVAPGYDMAEVLAANLTCGLTPGSAEVESKATFQGGDLSAKLKLMGTDVASFGDPFCEDGSTKTIVFEDRVAGIYKKVILDADGRRVLGGMLVGDASQYATLHHHARSGDPVLDAPEELILGVRGARGAAGGVAALPEGAQVCSCNNVSKGAICAAVRDGCGAVGDVRARTTASSTCGGCLPLVTDIVNAELAALGRSVEPRLCEHFAHTRQELFEIVQVTGIRTFADLVASHGQGAGCEVCKPAVASIFASIWNEMPLRRHATLQDTNDRFLANIQRKGLYSIVPRVPGGEITPDKLIALGQIGKKYGLYTKITGGQRIDLFGARLHQLPDIWEELVDAGFESGHAYAKGVRTVKSCVGTTWCRFGVQDSVSFAIEIENRYKGLRAPHKLKSAVSGCVRECAEAQSKDFGVIATEKGWNLYVCGNGGAKPRHADMLAADIDSATVIKYIDRFLMFYIRTADKLTRTSVWLEKLGGGIDHLRDVVVRDSLGLGAELERQMQALVDGYECEWAAVVRDPEQRVRFRQFAEGDENDDDVSFVVMRQQKRPSDWPPGPSRAPTVVQKIRLPIIESRWTQVARVQDVPENGGIAAHYGRVQIAVFHYAADNTWFATQNMCPHRQDTVLARGLLGDTGGKPKVACPLHKRTFSLETGECLSGDGTGIRTFPTRVKGGHVYVELPPVHELERELCRHLPACAADAAE
jgi:nitrite reductase (NADH) large subunit